MKLKVGTNPPFIIPYHCSIHNFSSLDKNVFDKHCKDTPHFKIGQFNCPKCHSLIKFDNVPQNQTKYQCSKCHKIVKEPKPKGKILNLFFWDSIVETNRNDIL